MDGWRDCQSTMGFDHLVLNQQVFTLTWLDISSVSRHVVDAIMVTLAQHFSMIHPRNFNEVSDMPSFLTEAQ